MKFNELQKRFYMNLAEDMAKKSKDPSTKVGCIIAAKDFGVIGKGWNKFPTNKSRYPYPWRRKSDVYLNTKYPYVIHAEASAILNVKEKKYLNDASLFVTLFPCNDCAKLIIESGIKTVYFLSDKYHDSMESTASRIMLLNANIKLIKPETRIRAKALYSRLG